MHPRQRPRAHYLGPHYRQVDHLGSSGRGITLQAIDTRPGGIGEVAIKLLPRGGRLDLVRLETQILHQGVHRHPFIMPVKEVLLTADHVLVVMEYAQGGNVLTPSSNNHARGARGHIEARARFVFQQLIVAIDYTHRMGMPILLLKLRDLLICDTETRRPIIRFAEWSNTNTNLAPRTEVLDDPLSYMPPENVFGVLPYNPEMGLPWTCGMFLYLQMYGQLPFNRQDPGFLDKFQRAEFSLPPDPDPSGVVDLLRRCLVREPEQRISIDDIKRHHWFLEDLPDGALAMNDTYLEQRGIVNPQLRREIDALLHSASHRGNQNFDLPRIAFA